MIVFGWTAAVVGSVLFIVSLVRMVRANTDMRIPYVRSPAVTPAGTIAMRSAGAGLLVFGAAALTSTLGYWSVLVVFAGPCVALVVIPLHNRRLTGAPGR